MRRARAMRSQRTTSAYLLAIIVGITSQVCEHAHRLQHPASSLRRIAPQENPREDTQANAVSLPHQHLKAQAAGGEGQTTHWACSESNCPGYPPARTPASLKRKQVRNKRSNEVRRCLWLYGSRTSDASVQATREADECWFGPTEF
jgi:hypothetical protein